MLRPALIAAISSLPLASCSQTVGGCPPLATYSPAQQKQAAAEVRALPKGSQVGQLVVDYGKMRDACRATNAAAAH